MEEQVAPKRGKDMVKKIKTRKKAKLTLISLHKDNRYHLATSIYRI